MTTTPSHMRFLLAFALSITIASSIGQDLVDYQQTLAVAPLQLPELSGWHGGLQVNALTRSQWTGSSANRWGYFANVDAYVHPIRSGVGISAQQQNTSGGAMQNTSVSINLSPKIKITEELYIAPAVTGSFYSRSWNGSRQNNVPAPWPFDSTLQPSRNQLQYMTLGAGLAVYFGNAFVVAHSDHLTRPNVSYYPSETDRMAVAYQFIAGRLFDLGPVQFTPTMFCNIQDTTSNLRFAMNGQLKGIYGGVSYGNNGVLTVAAGYEFIERIRIAYSYDTAPSPFGGGRLGSHELSLRVWLFKERSDHRFIENLPLL